MKKIAIGILIAIVIIVAAVLIIAATKPDTFRVQRSIGINASPEAIAGQIDDFHKWTSWSPYEKKDPAMKRIYTGAEQGKGAVYEWKGDSRVGEGRMEIMNASASRITIRLDFLKPFEGHDTAEFTLEPEGKSTKVTWAMYGRNRFIGKIMSVFFNMDKMVGRDFETGLRNLKSVAER
jgi:hypothetical protein